MAKARSRVAARKMKDKWRAKNWYNIVAPPSFDNVTIADTLTDDPEKLINRVTEVSMQDMTNDFRKSHITLHFKIHKISESNAQAQFVGHSLTSDYLRRMIRRRRSKIEGVYDVSTKDGAVIRIKPFATTDKRIQNSQKRIVREAMKKTIFDHAKTTTLSEFVKYILDGKIGSDIYKNCRKLYPVKRIEIYKTEVVTQPTIVIEEKKTKKKEEEKPEEKEEKPKEKKETKKVAKKEEKPEIEKEKPAKEEKEPAKPEKKEKKPKKTPTKKTTKKTTAKKSTKKPTAKKTTTKKAAKKTTKKSTKKSTKK